MAAPESKTTNISETLRARYIPPSHHLRDEDMFQNPFPTKDVGG